MCGEDSKIAAVCAATPKKKMCISSLKRSPYNQRNIAYGWKKMRSFVVGSYEKSVIYWN